MGTGKREEIGTAQFLYEQYKNRFKNLKPPKDFENMIFSAISPNKNQAVQIYNFYKTFGSEAESFFACGEDGAIKRLQGDYIFEVKIKDEVIGYLVLGPPESSDLEQSYHIVWPIVKKEKRLQHISVYLNLACFFYSKNVLKLDRVSVMMWAGFAHFNWDTYNQKRKEYAKKIYEGIFGLRLEHKINYFHVVKNYPEWYYIVGL